MQEQFAISLTWRNGYEFEVDFEQEGVAALITDEPPPLGAAAGPNPARLLAAAVGNCMSASLKFCLERARIEVQGLKTTVEGTLVRNERGRLRIGSLRVRLHPTLEPEALERIARCLDVFEDFCIVGQSVRDGIDIDVEVVPAAAPVAAAGSTPE
ncbi:MAG TPA: OsmC family protein [Longimicrobiales bacterium]